VLASVAAGLLAAALASALAACGSEGGPLASTVVAGSGLRAVEVVRGLDRPVYLTATAAEPGRLYVVEQAGVVRVVEDGRVLARPFLDVSARVLTSPKGEFASERGLLSLAFAPDYGESGRFVVFFTDRRGAVNVVEYRARNGRALPRSGRALLRVRKRSRRHHGGQLQFGPDGRLYASIGDDAMPRLHAQSLADGDFLGKILRLDPGGWTVVGYGLRNPWRFSFDRETGDLWVGDVGESGFEEVSTVPHTGPALVNFGWDAYEGFAEAVRLGGGHGEVRGPGELVWPVAQYGHDTGCAVTGGYVYRGAAVPDARGRYLYGDYCTGAVWSLDPGRPGEVRLELELGTTLASFGEDAAGELYLVSRTGRIFRLAAG
jgi:glucose/arabinose dehydrogenase